MMYASTSIVARVIGVIRLDPPTIRSITRDPRGTWQAAAVVAIVALAAALGSVEAWSAGLLLLMIGGLAVWGLRSGHAAGMMAAFGHGNASIQAERIASDGMRRIRAHGLFANVLAWIGIVGVVIGLHVLFFWAIGGLLLPVLAWLIFSGVAFLASTHVFGEPTTQVEFAPILRLSGFALAPGVLAIFNVIPFIGGVAMLIAIVWALVAVTFAIRQTVMFGMTRAALTTLTSALVTLVACGVVAAFFG